MSIEAAVKQQFAKVFQSSDWHLFKKMADFYLRRAAFLRKADIPLPPDLRLRARNSQKRLFIGVGCELLVKALYLKNGYAINKPRRNQALQFPLKLSAANPSQLDEDQTFLFDNLICRLEKVTSLESGEAVLNGLKIAKVFRNKEAHLVTSKHDFDSSNYRDIETSLKELYRIGFDESLVVRFSLAPNEQPLWAISRLPSKSTSSALTSCF